MVVRQKRRNARNGTGIGIDASGGPVIDPTENVLALVDVEKDHQKELDILYEQHIADLRIADTRRQDDLRAAESNHRDKQDALKERYDEKIFNIQTVQVKTTSDLISAQLAKETQSLANRQDAASVQQQSLIATLSDRIGKLEQERWTVSGKSSVSDPATSDAITKMAASIQALTESKKQGEGVGIGRGEVIAWVFGIVGGFAAIATAFFEAVKH
jgi:hypothetical protein